MWQYTWYLSMVINNCWLWTTFNLSISSVAYSRHFLSGSILGMTNYIWWWDISSWYMCPTSLLAITPMSTLTWSDSTHYGPNYRSNRSIWKLFFLDKNTWYHLPMSKNWRNYTKIYNFLNSRHNITLDKLIWH